ncbi:RAMP superfamily CRISPR-associated protein [Thiohalocapsa sp. ML1]|jgi:hypothetical protein|uniref:RAMP superfamily CRISPR-associated protein n=1 Tax=Thiohalocapsa sp. ML1 TaxID=1431688 RepID=UPI00073242F2|nr:RAMP superfamily CRISPR-associated protein [Thiohalocapsa sp. ML1]
MKPYTFRVRLTCAGPVLSRSLEAGRLGIDALPLRAADAQHTALPGTQVRGLLRDAWTVFADADPQHWPLERLQRWLGPDPDASNHPNKPVDAFNLRPARLDFDALWIAADLGTPGRLQHRIRIDPATGAVARGQLLTLESPHAPAEEVSFSGEIRARLDDAAEAAELLRWLQKACAYVHAVGGLRGIGYGRVLSAAASLAEEPAGDAPGIPDGAGPAAVRRIPAELDLPFPAGDADTARLRLGLSIRPLAELCFPRPGPKGSAGNRFSTETHIPGAALKALLAARWPKQNALLAPLLDPLRITHAHPVNTGTASRPLAVPMSFAFTDAAAKPNTLHLRDLALQHAPGLLGGKAPRFQPDWKPAHWTLAQDWCGWPEKDVPRGLRVRNRIDPQTGSVKYNNNTESGMLFSVETLIPGEHRWLADLDLPKVSRAQWQPLLALLAELCAAPLAPLGKTKAAVAVELRPEPCGIARGSGWRPRLASYPAHRDAPIVVLLQSAAALLPPGWHCRPSNDGAALHHAYADVFRRLSNHKLDLAHAFTREALAGGRYWWSRFQRRERDYHPVLLTQPGSVFVLRARRGAKLDAIQQVLQCWDSEGLPAVGAPPAPGNTRPASAGLAGDHKHNPWIPQNGYGEVVIDPACARDAALQPQREEWHGLED